MSLWGKQKSWFDLAKTTEGGSSMPGAPPYLSFFPKAYALNA